MKASQFIELLPADTRKRVSKAALNRWFIIYAHVFATGQTDRYDAQLQKKLGWASEATLQRVLKQMATANLLEAHRVLVKYSEMGKALLRVGLTFAMQRDGPPPGVFIRYTLPGMSPPLKGLPSPKPTPR